MTLSRAAAGRALLLIFIVSGVAGLIYQAIWSHYLGLTLGHAAYAQTLVLAIFMGGMAVGAWWAGARTLRWKHLVLAYAVVEAVIGVMGLLFHPVFVLATDLGQDTVLPALESQAIARLYQWLSAALLIAPQSILLGATFPLLSAGYLRLEPAQDGKVLGGLYFTNSLGAAAGALLATFWLLPAVGMPGTVMAAGVLNLAVAVLAWAVWRMAPDISGNARASRPPSVQPEVSPDAVQLGRILMVATALSGATSFFYEITWVRMLNMALGTTVHSFELMLAAFILGLAFGGLWIRRRHSAIQDAVAWSGYAQLLMGAAAILSAVVFAHSFQWVAWMHAALDATGEGYTLYIAGSAVVALLVMFPAAFFAGMTLPLFTMALLRAGAGESSIGRIYAANTLGAILGVAAVVHIGIPFLGLNLSLWCAGLVDILLGVYLLRRVSPARWTFATAGISILVLVVAVAGLSLGKPSASALASGVFRTGSASISDDAEVHFMRDGKTSTVAVFSARNNATITTNGKPDASLGVTLDVSPPADEVTMLMAAALPLIAHPAPERVAVIGWGSGLTTHTLLGSGLPRSVDTIEIEPAMWEAASLFGARVERAYQDPRSHVRFEDARTWFATGGRNFDVIVSEPSNPWVSGVASLFTKEWYRFIRGHLRDGGMLVQWIQTYELSDALLATMIAALLEEFQHVDVFAANDVDLLFVARPAEDDSNWLDLRRPGWADVTSGELGAELARVGLASSPDYELRHIADARVLRTLVAIHGANPHSDFHPVVSLEAPRARFMTSRAYSLQNLAFSGLPVLEALGVTSHPPGRGNVTARKRDELVQAHERALSIADGLRSGSPGLTAGARAIESALVRVLVASSAENFVLRDWSDAVVNLANQSIGHLPPKDLEGAWIDPEWDDHVRGLSVEAGVVLDGLEAIARRDPAAMQEAAEAILAWDPNTVAPALREYMLVAAMLAEAMQGRAGMMTTVDERLGTDVAVSSQLGFLRTFLLAWAQVIGDDQST